MSTVVEYDLESETLVRLVDAGRYVPRAVGIKPPVINTLHRWRLVGAQGVKLQCKPINGVWHTSVEAIKRFVDARAQAMMQPAVAPISDTQRDRHNRATRAELASLGIGTKKSPKS